jgi:hypothetical protein
VSGKVRLGNLIAYDSQTGSEWLQETGEALEGPMKGRRLATLEGDFWKKQVRWDEWLRQHPQTLVLVDPKAPSPSVKE